MGQGLCLEPATRGEAARGKEGLWSVGFQEFGGGALRAGVRVGFRPSELEGVSECRGGALGGGPGWGCRGGAWALHGRREAPRAKD